ncbi:MAG: HpsJ family protein [Synechococcaceae cyanobacterium ELA739]
MNSDKLASSLLNLAYALFAVFLVVIVVDSFPIRLLDPDWILTVSATLVNVVTIPLVGLGLVHLAVHIASESRYQLIQRRLSRLASWAAVGFFLILPLLALLTFLNGLKIEKTNALQKDQIELKAKQIRKAVVDAQTPKELQSAMVALQGPRIESADFNQPLPQIKQQILAVVNQAKASFLLQQKGPYDKQYLPVFKQVLRIALLSLVSGFGFAALAWNPKTDRTLLGAWIEAFGALGSALKLAAIKRTLSQWIKSISKNSEANRVARSRRNQAKLRDRAVRRQEAITKAEFKRKENEFRKIREREEKIRDRDAKMRQREDMKRRK